MTIYSLDILLFLFGTSLWYFGSIILLFNCLFSTFPQHYQKLLKEDDIGNIQNLNSCNLNRFRTLFVLSKLCGGVKRILINHRWNLENITGMRVKKGETKNFIYQTRHSDDDLSLSMICQNRALAGFRFIDGSAISERMSKEVSSEAQKHTNDLWHPLSKNGEAILSGK